jgi:hypothetical protein
MARDVSEVGVGHEWGPVSRGFRVSLPGGERGCIEEIRRREGEIELVVATGLFVRRLVTVRAHEVEAILPGTGRIIVRGSNGAAAADADELEAAGGIVRMPVRHSPTIASSPKETA